MAEVDIALLRQKVRYAPATGLFQWRDPSEPRNGTPAFYNRDGRGHLRGMVCGVRVHAHRAAWAIVHGEWPPQIDHINGDRADNRLENLRAADAGMNARNRKLPRHNTSGFIGVDRCARSGKWIARVCAGGRRQYVGRFNTAEKADAACRRARQGTGFFHENHGHPL